jgi:deoxycytidylate deaminase
LPEEGKKRYLTMVGKPRPELVIGLVGAVGSPLEEATQALKSELDRFGYSHRVIHLSSLLPRTPASDKLKQANEFERIESSMDAGTWLRQQTGRGDALLALAITEMANLRAERSGQSISASEVAPALDNHAFILRSLKHPHEVSRLRALYRAQFLLIGVYASRDQRLDALADRLAHSIGGRADNQRANAERLISRDAHESGTDLGQSVSETFPLADAFITADRLREGMGRILALFFRAPYVTPTRDEQGMFFAQAAALRSSALSRQVGACIASANGDLLAVGCNEVPKAGGGQYWAGEEPDGRDFNEGYDRNDRLKERVVRELITELRAQNWIASEVAKKTPDELAREMMSQSPPPGVPRLRQTQIGALTEFGRDVHAEMAALMTLARSTSSATGANLYSTTFPCHNCAKHILAAGIRRVIYVEPYPKSFASEFHSEAIAEDAIDGESGSGRLLMTPFSGVAPRKYLEWFRAPRRKDETGRVVAWPGTHPQPVFIDPQYGGYDQALLDAEAPFIKEVLELMSSLPAY